ncbi:MAG: glycosyltransferase [Desulfobulbaceae bacterium]|nr:glycosyltransferase [Candidatus Kapabacteria bacterium]MBS4001088.1 glycosyltransferase [Desulfobulbaceae bacterium]
MAMNRIQFVQDIPHGFSNKSAKGRLPEVLPDKLMLNLGCGRDVREGFLNIDLYSENENVVSMDIRNLELPDSCAEFILASDVLEHFSHRETDAVLKEWARVLKPGGKIEIRCPNLRLQMNAYQRGDWDADVASYMVFGGQTNPGDYHCVAFDEKSISKHLEKAELKVESITLQDYPQSKGLINLNMTVVASKRGTHTISKPESRFDWLDFKIDSENFNVLPEDEPFEIDMLKELVGDIENRGEPTKDVALAPNKDQQLNVVWEGSQFVYHSLALINREHCINLTKSGAVNLTIIPYEPDTFDPKSNEKFKSLIENDIRYKSEVSDKISALPYVWIRHQWPPKTEAPNGAKWIIMQPWEFSVLREDFVDLFKQADELWTPSNFSRKAFIESGIDAGKVQVIPNGIDPTLFKPDGEKFELPTKKQFKMLFVGGTIFRKGIDLLLRAYAENFTAEDDICLVIKDMGGSSFYKGQTAKNHIEQIRSKSNSPEIIYLQNDMSEQEMASLYRACNVLVSPYRGEGFSLPVLEAMACGLPVIVTENGATDDFAHGSFALKIKSTKRSIGNKLDDKPFVKEAFLLEPDFDELKSILKSVYDNPGHLRSMGALAQFSARTDWTWRGATIKALTRLDSLYSTNTALKANDALEDFSDASLMMGAAENSYIAEDYDNATSAYISVISNKDSVSHEYYILSLCRMIIISINKGDYDTADNFISELERISPGHTDLYYVKAIYLASKDMIVEALESITVVMDSWKTRRFDSSMGYSLDDLLVLTADLLLAMEDYESAHNLYTVALSLNSQNSFACFGTAMCFESVGATEEALTMYEWAYRLNPEFESARIKLEELSQIQ